MLTDFNSIQLLRLSKRESYLRRSVRLHSTALLVIPQDNQTLLEANQKLQHGYKINTVTI